jgi:hypothetical protein
MKLEELNTTLVCLDEDGRLFRLPLKAQEVALNEEEVFSALMEGHEARIRDALIINKQPVSLCIVEDKTTWLKVCATIPLPFVRFNTEFKMQGEVMVPVFNKPTGSNPRLNVDWDVRAACSGKVRLWLLVLTKHNSSDPNHYIGECYLVATSSTNKMYRIPLANVYDDCKICMGDQWNGRSQPTLPAALDAALQQFLNSPWNSDLKRSPEKSDAFFRFKPVNDGFETLPVDGQWSNLCERVAAPVDLDYICLPKPEGGAE